MEIQLSELIEQIKNDGVKSAEAESAAIIEGARAEADRIVAEAKAEAARMIGDASEETRRMVFSAEEAIKQAGRNLLLSFRESVKRELAAVTGDKLSEVYSADVLASLVPKAVEAYARSTGEEDISVLLSPEELASIEGSLLASLKERMLTGVTLKPGEGFDRGFRISVRDGSVYYDYSAEAVCEMLSAYLTPKVASLMKEAGKE